MLKATIAQPLHPNPTETAPPVEQQGEPGTQVAAKPTRYFALDGVRATAMLLGVFYHLPIAFMAGGFGMGLLGGSGFGASPKTLIDNWLHSFRMPLFFLISGFFANMMLGKYGLKRYLTRRWWRIGAPLILALLLLAGVRIATSHFQKSPMGSPFGAPTAPLPGFGPMPGMQEAASFGGATGGFGAGGAGISDGTPHTANEPDSSPFPFPGGTFGPPGSSSFGGSDNPAFAPPFALPQFPSRDWANRLFGDYSRHLSLEHLWFLWYLLIFVTVGPLIVTVFSRVFSWSSPDKVDGLGKALVRFNVLAFVLALVTLPALIHARGFVGWSLANPIGFSGAFPDFLLQYYADEPFYLCYFLAGWWFFRLKDSLPDLARYWLWNFVLGIVGFAASQALSDAYAMQHDMPHYQWIRLGSFALYGLGTAYSTFGFLGFFQRFLNRPTKIGRYIADTALWIYLAHLPLIPYLLWWFEPWRSAWWASSIAGMVIVTGVTLVVFELVVRPTPLVYVFGPASPRRRAADKS